MKKLWQKWTLLVWANALIGLWFSGALSFRSPDFTLGLALGVCVFIPCYVWLDNWAIKTGNHRLHKSLWISVIVRACLQLIIIIDMYAGMMAINIGDYLPNAVMDIKFFEGFILTVLTGAILSAFVAVLTGILIFVFKYIKTAD